MRTSPSGWVAIDRNVLESPIWEKPAAWIKVWLWLKCTAAWRDTETYKAGQLHSTYNPTQLPGVSPKEYRRAIAWLEDSSLIKTQRERYGFLITILDTKPTQDDEQKPDSVDAEFKAWFALWPVQRHQLEANRSYRSARAQASASDLQAGRDKLIEAIRFGHIATNRVPYAHRWLNAKRWTDSYSAPKVQPKTPNLDPRQLRETHFKHWSDKLYESRQNTAACESIIAACRKATANFPLTNDGETLTDEVISLVNYWKEHRKE